MKTSWFKRTVADLAILLLVAGLVFTDGCKKSSPTDLEPNPPAPPAQPLIMTGYVKDASSQSAISGAAVRLSKADKTVLATLSSGTDGSYTYDASSVTDTVLTLYVSKVGYGYGQGTAKIVKASNTALVADIFLDKLVVASATVTPAAGGTVTAPAQPGVSTAPVTVTVPPNAVPSNVTLTAAPVSIAQVPAPAAAGTAVLGAAQFGPTGTVFSVPVTISIPTAAALTPGSTFPLQVLNETTGEYTNSGFTATANAAGTAATAPVTHFTTYTIGSTITITLNAGTSVLGNAEYYELFSGRGTKTFTATVGTLTVSAGTVNETTVKAWIMARGGPNFIIAQGITVGGNFPALPANFQINGVQVNPNVAGKGSWSYRWYVQPKTTPYSGSITFLGSTQTITASYNEWVLDASRTGWYWRSHDQGGAVSGPY